MSGCLVLGSALAQQWGAELAAERVLPVLCPLLASPSLSPGHFAAALQCEQAGCGSCHECRTALGGSHADITLVRTEKLSIGVDEVRDLVVARRPAPG